MNRAVDPQKNSHSKARKTQASPPAGFPENKSLAIFQNYRKVLRGQILCAKVVGLRSLPQNYAKSVPSIDYQCGVVNPWGHIVDPFWVSSFPL